MQNYKYAVTLVNSEKFEKAVSLLNAFLKENPKHQESYMILADAYFYLRMYSYCFDVYTRMTKRYPSDERPYIGKAFIQTILGEFGEAEKLLKKAMGLNDRNWKVYFTWGYLNVRKGKYSYALKMFEKANTKNPLNDPICYIARACAFCSDGNISNSKKYINYAVKAINDSSNYASLYDFQVKLIRYLLMKHEEMSEKFQKLSKVDKSSQFSKYSIKVYETYLSKQLLESVLLNDRDSYLTLCAKMERESLANSQEETYYSSTEIGGKDNKLICYCTSCQIF